MHESFTRNRRRQHQQKKNIRPPVHWQAHDVEVAAINALHKAACKSLQFVLVLEKKELE
jgi:hypothetical protein